MVIPNWATQVRPGPATAIDENTQQLSFSFRRVGQTNPGDLVFTVPPQITNFRVDPVTNLVSADLEFQTAPDSNTSRGPAVFEVTLVDNGTASPPPNVNLSAASLLTITVQPVNDAPQFTIAGSSQTVDEDAAGVTVPNFITNIKRGPDAATDEVGQKVDFLLALSQAMVVPAQ
ncbi:MAG: hypothetical protein HC802_10465, partial [Caldilineaceae bacterium]|nr:hypothetical protein [Caldilineaceae bacterium]